MSLDRFHRAQAGETSGYSTALAEMRLGRKRSHWIWYVFPQLAGLGRSLTAQEFALRDFDEACDYLRDPLLRARYMEISAVVATHLEKGEHVGELMGGATDAMKLASSLTLFRSAALRLAVRDSDGACAKLAAECDRMLERMADQGYAACQFTLERSPERKD